MSAAVKDIPAVVSKWTLREKRVALAVLLRELTGMSKSGAVVIEDESKKPVGIFLPTDYTVKDLDLNADTPEMHELKRRAQQREKSISHEELLKLLHEVDAKQGRV